MCVLIYTITHTHTKYTCRYTHMPQTTVHTDIHKTRKIKVAIIVSAYNVRPCLKASTGAALLSTHKGPLQ